MSLRAWMEWKVENAVALIVTLDIVAPNMVYTVVYK